MSKDYAFIQNDTFILSYLYALIFLPVGDSGLEPLKIIL